MINLSMVVMKCPYIWNITDNQTFYMPVIVKAAQGNFCSAGPPAGMEVKVLSRHWNLLLFGLLFICAVWASFISVHVWHGGIKRCCRCCKRQPSWEFKVNLGVLCRQEERESANSKAARLKSHQIKMKLIFCAGCAWMQQKWIVFPLISTIFYTQCSKLQLHVYVIFNHPVIKGTGLKGPWVNQGQHPFTLTKSTFGGKAILQEHFWEDEVIQNENFACSQYRNSYLYIWSNVTGFLMAMGPILSFP